MNLTQQAELQLLQIRDAIADKERFVANANLELSRGEWMCNWNDAFRDCDNRIEKLTASLRAVGVDV